MKNKNNSNVNVDDDIDNLFGAIEGEDQKKSAKTTNSWKNPDLLALTKNQTVKVILLPYKKEPTKTFVTYEKIGFYLKDEKKVVDLGLSPKSANVRKDPVSTLQWEIYDNARKVGDKAKMKESFELLPKREEVVNVLVLEDSQTPENVGTVKVLKYNAALNKNSEPISVIYSKIREAIFGDKKAKIGQKAFLTPKYDVIRPLVIKVKEKGGFNDYTDTSFDDEEEHGFDKAQIMEFYDQCHDLSAFVPELKSNEELQSLLDEFWHRTDISKEDDVPDDDDMIDEDDEPAPTKKTTIKERMQKKSAESSKKAEVKKDEVDDMIDDIEFEDEDEDDIVF